MYRISTAFIGVCALFANVAAAEPAISIGSIRSDDLIEGTVTGLEGSSDKYCAVVYIHTNLWHIHPYAGAGRERSWAEIRNNRWSIATVKREFPANGIAALILRKEEGDCPAPDKLENLGSIPRRVGSPFRRDLRPGDAWYRLL